MENEKKKISIMDVILFIIFILLLAFPAYLCYQVIVAKNNNQQTEDTTQENLDTTSEDINVTGNTEDNSQVLTEPHYEEMFETISGQLAYIAIPTNIDTNNPPSIVIYSHGSNTLVTEDTTDSFTQDLQSYGNLFTTKNFIFAASNEHGENWGNADSVDDMYNLLQWIQNSYPASNNIYLIGFSMGGLPTIHFVEQYPENVKKIALLAPTTKSSEWNTSNISILDDIQIQIWHGTSDVNIPISSSRTFITNMKKLGKNITLVELQGKTHFDVDAEYMDDILSFFEAN